MAMTTKDFRRRIHVASFQRHNGKQDATGSPTYANAADWETLFAGWPCELRTNSGQESASGNDGRDKTFSTTDHVLIGQYFSLADQLRPTDRAVIAGVTYNIVSIRSPDGLSKTLEIDVTQTW